MPVVYVSTIKVFRQPESHAHTRFEDAQQTWRSTYVDQGEISFVKDQEFDNTRHDVWLELRNGFSVHIGTIERVPLLDRASHF